jgi:hypothetical protein
VAIVELQNTVALLQRAMRREREKRLGGDGGWWVTEKGWAALHAEAQS